MTAAPAHLPERRRALLARDAAFNGVDYAERRPGHIDVHFINRVRVKGTLAQGRPPVTLTASGAVPAPVVHLVDEDTDWSTDTSGRPVLHLRAGLPDAPGRYLLTVHSARIDPCLASAAITVRGGTGDAVGCGASQAEPPGLPGGQPVAVDYLAKDFTSFLAALSNFSAARYPLWGERSEADFGVMLMEALSALADELSYLQDRVAAEATIGTATQRLSLVRHTRLVDYEPMPTLAARTVLQFDVAPPSPDGVPLPNVIGVQALGGQSGTVTFTAGLAFSAGRPALDSRWNRYDQSGSIPQLVPYLGDPSVTWLRRGATSMWVSGHGHGFHPGQQLLIDTPAAVAGDPPVREIVQLTEAEERTDPVQARQVTLIRWSDRLASDHDLTRTQLAGNLVPAVQGQVTEEIFAIPGDTQPPAAIPGGGQQPGIPSAVIRADHSDTPAHYLYTLASPLAWQAVPAADGGPARPRPLLALQELAPAGGCTEPSPNARTERATLSRPNSAYLSGKNGARADWQWVRRLIDAGETARVFTITPERYSPAADVSDPPFFDYDGDGATVRFGDGTFGRPPTPGTTFRARYLAGSGEAGNVAADTIVAVAPGDPANGLVWRCTNPFAATGGADAETHAQVRDQAPQQASSGLLTLTGPADYVAAALSFSLAGPRSPQGAGGSQGSGGPQESGGQPGAGGPAWARQAVAAARWTGSWLSTVTIADPLATEPLATQLAALAGLAEALDARRLAGTGTSVALARYRWLDLRITCATRPGHRPGDVTAAVLAQLSPWPGTSGRMGSGTGGATGFFGRDKWMFGQPLDASALVAAIQSCPGVAGVTCVDYRWAHSPEEWQPLPATLGIAPGEILRIDNDPDQPGHGLLFVTAEGPR